MAESELAKYIRKTESPDLGKTDNSAPKRLIIKNNGDFGDRVFSMATVAIIKPHDMVAEHHYHDFDQYLFFTGGDPLNLPELGGEVELTLSKNGKNLEEFTITESTCVYIPAGMWHCPLRFKKINDPEKPILFTNLFYNAEYIIKK